MTAKSVGPARRLAATLTSLGLAVVILATTSAAQAGPPEIRTSDRNKVPACVTPERLMAFLRHRNRDLHRAFADVGNLYKRYGDQYRVRWDYAFFQMLLETNYLSYRTGSGRWGDVNPNQFNFAGIGATGGGVPGDRFKDARSGVLAQIQHLVVYSGEHVDKPVAQRTRDVQDDVINESRGLRRPVTFRDLTMRWAIDRSYWRSIESIAERYRSRYCNGREEIATADDETRTTRRGRAQSRRGGHTDVATAEPSRGQSRRGLAGADEDQVEEAPPQAEQPEPEEPQAETPEREEPEETRGEPTSPGTATEQAEAEPQQPAGSGGERTADATPAGSAAQPAKQPAPGDTIGTLALIAPPTPAKRPTCKVYTASYGGVRNVLIRALVGNELHYTALQVLDGQEDALAASYIRTHATGGQPIGAFANRETALLKAFDLCPKTARAE